MLSKDLEATGVPQEMPKEQVAFFLTVAAMSQDEALKKDPSELGRFYVSVLKEIKGEEAVEEEVTEEEFSEARGLFAEPLEEEECAETTAAVVWVTEAGRLAYQSNHSFFAWRTPDSDHPYPVVVYSDYIKGDEDSCWVKSGAQIQDAGIELYLTLTGYGLYLTGFTVQSAKLKPDETHRVSVYPKPERVRYSEKSQGSIVIEGDKEAGDVPEEQVIVDLYVNGAGKYFLSKGLGCYAETVPNEEYKYPVSVPNWRVDWGLKHWIGGGEPVAARNLITLYVTDAGKSFYDQGIGTFARLKKDGRCIHPLTVPVSHVDFGEGNMAMVKPGAKGGLS